MCFGTQEYFLGCHCPGTFQLTIPCRKKNCTNRVESRIVFLPGSCPECHLVEEIALHHPSMTHPNRSRSRSRSRNRSHGTHHHEKFREVGTSRWATSSHLHAFYDRSMALANAQIERAMGRYQGTDCRDVHLWVELQKAITEQRDVSRAWAREVDLFWEERGQIEAMRIDSGGNRQTGRASERSRSRRS